MKKIHITFILFVSFVYFGNAQDAHLSQYFNLPLFTNPALAGSNIQNMRIAIDYRSQWVGASNFKTQTIGIDKIVNKVGFGLQLSKNTAGNDGFNRLSILGGLNYRFSFGHDGLHQLRTGFQIGLMQKSFNPNEMSFENQYTYDVGYDPNASSGETFANTKVTRPDAVAGISYQFAQGNATKKFKPFAGISFAHINKPTESFIEENSIIPVRTNMQVGTSILCSEKVELKPMLLFMKQQSFKELNAGMLAEFAVKSGHDIKTGLFYRSKDAVIVYAGYQLNKVLLGTSYDVNTNPHKGGGSGAFELSMVYTPQGKPKGAKMIREKETTKPTNKKKLPEPAVNANAYVSHANPIQAEIINQKESILEIKKPAVIDAAMKLPDDKRKVNLTQVLPEGDDLIYLNDKNFEWNSYVVFDEGKLTYNLSNRFDVVEAMVDYLYKYPEQKILLAGNTTQAEQMQKPALGMMRAEAVKAYLTGKGIDANRIKVVDLKNADPRVMLEDGKKTERNSRVDIYKIK